MSNFQQLEVVGRGSETQFQVGENLNKSTQQDKGLTLTAPGSTLVIKVIF